MKKLTKTERDFHKQQCINALLAEKNRARSVSVGTAFGGTVELSMRGGDGAHMFVLMQPVEAIELLHQIAAGVGCHLTLRPRDDFSSWRAWRDVPGVSQTHIANNTSVPEHQTATQLPAPEQQPGLQPAMMARSESNEQTLATQKTVGRKRTKRAAAAA